MNYDVLPG